MTAQVSVASRDRPECWCCGRISNADELVHLGNHPEVTICTRCARSVGKWGREIEDRSRAGLANRARGQLRRLRKLVVRRGWQHLPIIGPPLRWLGRHTP